MTLSYCAKQLHEGDRDRFLQSLYIPQPQRDSVHSLEALNLELIRIHNNVSEEMIGHIRYAWWYEKIEALFEGKTTPGHPVLEALYPLVTSGQLPKPGLLALVETYRAHYPELPHDAHGRMQALELGLIRNLCPQAEMRWLKAGTIIDRHREKHAHGAYGRLSFKLLLV